MLPRRVLRWGIVLFLLATLPVMTVALAQGQEPVEKDPVLEVTEPGESASPATYNKYESEANNSRATADSINIGDVVGGKIGYSGDVDFFKYTPPETTGYVLIDMDARSIGSDNIDTVVCIYNSSGNLETCNDDAGDSPSMRDSILFWESDNRLAPYYIEVTDYNEDGGSSFNYELILSSPLLISADAKNLGTKTIAGISFQSQDILAWSHLNTGDEKWLMFFDGSDVSVAKPMASFTFGGDDIFWMVFPAGATLPGVGTTNAYRPVRFDFSRVGSETSGTFTHIYTGWNNSAGLSTTGEKIDAYDIAGTTVGCWGEHLSTVGAAKLNSVWGGIFNQADEDIFCWRESTPYGWEPFFDGTTVPGLGVEDVYALAWDNLHNKMLMTILGTGSISGHAVNQKQIFAVSYPGYSWGGYVWKGPEHGWNFNIDAFEMTGW
jgi:hypothetical protein